MTGDSEGYDDGTARVPAQWLERDGWDAGRRLVLGPVHFSDDAARATQQLRHTTGLSTASNTASSQASYRVVALFNRSRPTFAAARHVPFILQPFSFTTELNSCKVFIAHVIPKPFTISYSLYSEYEL